MRRSVVALVVALSCALSAVPAGAAVPWATTQLPGDAGKVILHEVSCPSPTLCVAVGSGNAIASSTNPAGGPAAWNVVYAGEGAPGLGEWPHPDFPIDPIHGISCPAPNLCVAVTGEGDVYTSTDPTGPSSAWAVADLDGIGQGQGTQGQNMHIYSVSCPSVNLCVAVTGRQSTSGRVLTSTNPAAGAASWGIAQLDPSLDLRSVSCGTPKLCVAASFDGRLVVSINPGGGPGAWRALGPLGGPGALGAVTCFGEGLCVAGKESGELLVSARPADGEAAWALTRGGGTVPITAVACHSATECLAADNNGDVLPSTDPTGGAEAWSFANVVPYTPEEGNAMFGAACPSSLLCVVTGARGRIYTSADPFGELREEGRRKRRPKRPRVRFAEVRPPFPRATRGRPVTALFRFYSDSRVRGYLCKIDRHPFRPCRSPLRFRAAIGRHAFRVRAIGGTGLKGPIARRRFTIHKIGAGAAP